MTGSGAKYQRLRQGILRASLLVGGLVVALALLAGWRDLRAVEAELLRDQRNLLLVTAEHARWTFWAADNVLNQTEQVIRRLGRPPTVDDSLRLYPELSRMLEPLGGSHRWFLVDNQGQVLSTALRAQAYGIDVSDHEYFQFHERRRAGQLHIGAPQQARPSGQWSFTVTRGVYDDDGRLMAVAGLAIGLQYFLDFYSRLDLGSDAAAVLARRDGQLLVRRPFDPAHFGITMTRLSARLDELAGRPDTRSGVSPFDGRERLNSVKEVDGYPAAVVMSVTRDGVIASWRQRMTWVGIAVVLLLAAIAGFATWMERQVRRLERADDRALRDRLTDLPNRRAFDEQFARELGRAQREGQPLLVALIDIDHFKAFNDSAGHAGGDQALRAVAAALQSALRRPSDLLARWGGEEFALLMPGCSATHAPERGEALRAAVQAAALPHPGRGAGAMVSVSVGLAVWAPGDPRTDDELLSAADAALYDAKRLGRDRVVLAR